MNAEVFLDTNIFIYQLDGSDPEKSSIAQDIIFQGLANRSACISWQVLQECVNTIRRKAEIPLNQYKVRQYVETVLFPLWTVVSTKEIYLKALNIHNRHCFAFWDSLIIASALDSGCSKLYTEDLQHGQNIQDLKIVDPFS
jgi:predicted nucleic acid-binding protein